MLRFLSSILIVATLGATAAHAKPPLREVAEIDDALFEIGVAYLISENCSDISGRKLAGVSFLWKLKRRANDLGYSDAEIDAYRKSKTEKARMRSKANAFFAAKGVDTSDPQSYCAVGLAEIQKSSRIGSLLRAK